MPSKFYRQDDYELWDPRGSHPLEVSTDESLRADYRIISGIGVRMHPGNITTLKVAYKLLDPDQGLGDTVHYQADGSQPSFEELERWVFPLEADGDENSVLAGLGARSHPGNLTTLRIWTRDIRPDGTLAAPREHRFGPDQNNPLEAQVMVPDRGVIVGWGLRAQPGNVTHAMAWYGTLKRRNT